MDKQELKIRIKQSLREENSSLEAYESLLNALNALKKEEQAELLIEVFEEIEQEPFNQNIPTAAIFESILDDKRVRGSMPLLVTNDAKDNMRPYRRIRKSLAWVAAIVVFMTFGFYLLQESGLSDFLSGGKRTVQEIAVVPGQQKAILVLPSGDEIALDSLQEGEEITVGNLQVSLENGVIRYDGVMESEAKTTTIRTPLGGDYQTTLPDGTKVWLNAGSSISYPVAFTDVKREVTMEGEVFFDVTKDKQRPFVVHAAGSSIQVLGTQFNVSAYQEDAALKATLVEGSIDFKHATEHRLLSPGHQVVVQKGQAGIAVHAVDVEEATAWKNGYFYFDNEVLGSAMQKIARWYDVEVVYEGSVEQKTLDGTISRMADVQELLKLLNLTGTAHFSLKERRIEVKI